MDGQSLSEITTQEGFDRKTIRRYLSIAEENGIQVGGMMPSEKVKNYTVKPKTAYRILRDKYELSVSYETFKLYVREIRPEIKNTQPPLPIEVEPGSEFYEGVTERIVIDNL